MSCIFGVENSCDEYRMRSKGVKIWPRSANDRGGYACMPMKKNISVGKSDWILATCPECKRECWETPLLKIALSQGAVAAIGALEKEISRGQYHCEDCLHLIDRTEGARGAISGICELRNWRGRRAGRTTACKKLKKGAK